MKLKICVDLPMRAVGEWDRWSGGLGLEEVARAVEQAGLHGIAMSDHPAPGVDWLAEGGHHTFDPFVALGVAATATKRIALLSNLAVAPYRSPFVLAKAATTVDVVSRGRFIMGIGPGYVREEFTALGVEFGRRGELTDRAIDTVRRIWAGEEFESLAGSRHQILPRPAQRACPVWVGGNSRAALRRVAQQGDGWLPFLQRADAVGIAGTDKLTSVSHVAERAEQIRSMRLAAGRSAEFDICLAPARIGKVGLLLDFLEQSADECSAAGINWLTWQLAAPSAEEALRALSEVAQELGTGG